MRIQKQDGREKEGICYIKRAYKARGPFFPKPESSDRKQWWKYNQYLEKRSCAVFNYKIKFMINK